MIKKVKDLKSKDVVFIPSQKLTCVVECVDTKSDWYDRTMIYFDGFDYAMKVNPDTLIPVIGQSTEVLPNGTNDI